MSKHIIAIENRWDDLSLNHGWVLIVEVMSGLCQWLADEELMERDEVFLVVMDCRVFFDFFFNLFCAILFLIEVSEHLELFGQDEIVLSDLVFDTFVC